MGHWSFAYQPLAGCTNFRVIFDISALGITQIIVLLSKQFLGKVYNASYFLNLCLGSFARL
jgi:hypothetical protein